MREHTYIYMLTKIGKSRRREKCGERAGQQKGLELWEEGMVGERLKEIDNSMSNNFELFSAVLDLRLDLD